MTVPEENDTSTPTVDVKRTFAVAGAMFLMAMSAAGPGFISQTGTFTAQYGASFAAAIVASVLIDIAIQLNVWRIVGLSGLRAQDLANRVVPYSGHVLAFLVVVGGLVFGIGNISAAGLGLHDVFGLDIRIGAVISAVLAIAIFNYKALEGTIDRAVLVLGVLKIGLIAVVAVITAPPVGEAALRTVAPVGLDFLPVLTLIGGTVGGYITYAGAHRLIESGTTGPENLRTITRGSVNGILVTGVLRILLFLGILGAVAAGAQLSKTDPAGSAFEHALGSVGLTLFGVVLWTAGMTSTIGASFTSATFLRTLSGVVDRRFNLTISAFITVCTIAFLVLGQAPSALLVFAGAFNGLILPFGLALLLWIGWRRRDLLAGLRQPAWLLVIGGIAFVFTVVAGVQSVAKIPTIFQ
ncbi:NRAMP family divalent metal transporter [Actinomycetospora termitidis]|uniref:Divalent metal cation transporter n=1 Tax=Actinomycetospora termitidis TaxID=3053470 RepID=A0ABT7M6W1_9PSEU|nr:NRAMP family divalent metal transporter [Actinomycetospora sp. Odt1-22]MDL5156394.1 divalent metal cation transporter [Actinomycetospora sp. Odt1-22]